MTPTETVLKAGQGREGWLGGLGIRFMISGEQSRGGFALVEHRLRIAKPRGQWHTFWNTGDEEARLLEIISPAGFERYFDEMVRISGGGRPDPGLAAPIRERHGLEVDPTSIAKLVAEHKISFGWCRAAEPVGACGAMVRVDAGVPAAVHA